MTTQTNHTLEQVPDYVLDLHPLLLPAGLHSMGSCDPPQPQPCPPGPLLWEACPLSYVHGASSLGAIDISGCQLTQVFASLALF